MRLLFALLFPAALHAQSDSAAVMGTIHRLFDGMRAGDSAMVRSTFDARIRLISSGARQGKVVTTVESNGDGFVKAVGTPHPDVWDERIRNPRVQIDGALASVWVEYAFFAGTKFSHCGIDHFLLAKDDAGAWKILELSDTRRPTGCEAWKSGDAEPVNAPRLASSR
jgi:hypothetical protein